MEVRLYNPDGTLCAPWSPSRSGDDAPFLCRWLFALSSAIRQRGGHIDAAALLHTWVRQHHSFVNEDVVHKEYWWPIGPLEYSLEHKTEWGDIRSFPKEAVEMMHDDLNVCNSHRHRLKFINLLLANQSFLQSGRPLLLGSGMSPVDVDYLQTNAQRELEEAKIPMMLRMNCVYAHKKAA
jgi:hypothetical protein